jgi:hypothetical protein
MIPVKIFCACGQKYSFEVQPHNGWMPVPVFCPVCGRDGTPDANQFIAKILHKKTQPLPPPSVNSLLNAAQSSLAPHLVDALKDAVVQELAAQRRALLAAQQTAAAELTELARRLEAVQMPMFERLRAYEQRISELEKELGEQSKENRELLKLKIEMVRSHLASERNRINFN